MKNPPARRKKKTEKKYSSQDYVPHKMMFTYRENPRTKGPSFEDFVRYIKKVPSNEALWIKAIVAIYWDRIQGAQRATLKEIDETVNRFIAKGIIPNDMWPVWIMARSGNNIKAAQTLIKESPDAIYLPFIAKAMLKVLRDHRNTTAQDRKLDEFKSQWEEFLIKRPHKKSPFSPKDLGRAIKLALKEIEQSTSTRKGDLMYEALEKTAKAIGMGIEELKKKARYR